MLNEPVKNIMMGDVTGLAREMELTKAVRKAEGGAATAAVTFTEEVRKIMSATVINQPADERGGNVPNPVGSNVNEIDDTMSDEMPVHILFAADPENHAAPLNCQNSFDTVNTEIKIETEIETSGLEALLAEGGLEKTVNKTEAHEIITHALARISEILNLPPEAAADFENDAPDFGVESLEQFADILWAIDKVISLLEKTDPAVVMENFVSTGFEAFNTVAKPEDLAAVTADLRKEKFNLEFGLRIVGAYEAVAEKMVERHDINTVTGINQAANPNDLGMSTSDLARAFSSLIKEELTSAMERVKKITSGQEEMTDLEKAAIRLGAVKSEILKAALNKSSTPESFAFDVESVKNVKNIKNGTEADVNIRAGTNINTNISTAVKNTNAAAAEIRMENVRATVVNANVNTNAAAAEAKTENVGANVRTNINVNINTDVNTNANTDANTNVRIDTNTAVRAETKTAKKSATDNTDLPISARESANRAQMVENVESANRMASRSVESVTTRIIAAESSVEVPVSAVESVNKQVADGNVNRSVNVEALTVKTAVANNTVEIPVSAAESASGKLTGSDGNSGNNNNTNNNDNGNGNNNSNDSNRPANSGSPAAKIIAADDGNIEIPVSAAESAKGKKSAADKSQPAVIERASLAAPQNASNVTNAEHRANAEARHEAAVKIEQTAQNAANISGKSESVSAGNNSGNSHNVSADTADRSLFNSVASTFIENSEGAAEAVDSGDEPQGVGQVKNETVKETAMKETEKLATTFSRLDNEAIIRQLSDRMHNALRAGVQEIRMTLRPEALGEVRMSIRMQGDLVVAQMQVENRQVKALVESNLQSLKEELAKQNISLGGFSVDVSGDSDRSPRQVWQEMAEAAELRKFRPDGGEAGEDSVDSDELDSLAAAPGSDTGRRFGNNTFEYFI
ncbi:MAG: flagellar hook-length control protein FliK [Chitinispirillales bacterium]|jgi:flagellar hook-length control protein FliK|nr:flagellar hook-length control protein FliK [Chitinispirillales bacterium]